MGGDVQPQRHVQLLVNMIGFGMNPQAARDAARLVHLGSQTSTGRTFDEKGGNLIVESGIPDTTIGSLRAKGHIVNRGGYCGGY
jgi:gamma-glutamyltranspeptidase / glutathione hydrolase